MYKIKETTSLILKKIYSFYKNLNADKQFKYVQKVSGKYLFVNNLVSPEEAI